MGHKATFYLECIKYAWHDSIDGANAAAPIPGAVIFYLAYFAWTGKKLSAPDTLPGIIELAAACLGAAWIMIFIIRLFLAPAHLYEKSKNRIEELEIALSKRTDKRRIRDSLSGFLMEGKKLMVSCNDETQPPPFQETDLWQKEIEEFLNDNLEPSFVARFCNPAGLPMAANSIASIQHRNLWAGIHFRLARLSQFLEEYAD